MRVHGRSMEVPRGVNERSMGGPWDVVGLLGNCRPFSVVRASIKKVSQNQMYCNKQQQQQTTIDFCQK